MRKLLTTILLLLPITLFAQNWEAFNPGWRYNYQLDTTGVIATSLYVDSITNQGLDTAFHLNSRTNPCATCGPGACDTCKWLADSPRFLLRNFKRLGNTYRFDDPDRYYLHIDSGVGTSWIFDSTVTNVATVISQDTCTLFGNLDSCRTIALSSGDTIVLSKSHGIIRFPNFGASNEFVLIGIHGPDLGRLNPTVFTVFDYSIGDVLQYHNVTWLTADEYTRHIKMTVVDRVNYGDSIEYTFHWLSSLVHMDWINFMSSSGWDTLTFSMLFTDSTFSAGLAPVTANKSDSYFSSPTPFANCYGGYALNRHFLGPNGYSIMLGNKGAWGPVDPDYPVFPSWQFGLDTLQPDFGGSITAHAICAEGVGLIQSHFFDFEYGCETNLEGYIFGGDTTGTIWSDNNLYLGIESPEFAQLKLYPNPVEDVLFVESSMMGNYEIFSSNGQVMLSGIITNRTSTINVDHLVPGVYLIRLTDQLGNSGVEHFIKQ